MKRIRGYYKKQWPENVKAMERDGFKCVKCGSTESVIVHHKDESRKNGISGINRNLDNLITLCRICHAEEHGFKLRFISPNRKIIEELNQSMTYSEIGKYLGISRQRVHQIVKKLPIDNSLQPVYNPNQEVNI